MNEVYTALQQNTVEGQENPFADSLNYSFDEVCKYWIKTNHVYSCNLFMMDRTYFNSLPEEIQNAVIEAAEYAGQEISAVQKQRDQEAEQKVLDEGCEVIEVDTKAFADYFDTFAEEKMKAYSKFLDIVEKIEKALLCISVAVMLVVMIYQVILRYVFAHATAWSEELARYLFIFQVMLASAIGIRRNSHLQIDALIHLLKPRWRMLSTVISTLIGVVFLCFLLVYSIDLVKTGANNLSVGLGVPMSIPYLCLPIGTVLMILTSVEVIFKQVRDFRKGGKEE